MAERSTKGFPRLVTPWDAWAAARSALFAGLVLLLVYVVTALTDEGQVAFVVRVGRALPAAPVCAALGAWLALRSSRARGELLALESLGRSPFQMGAPAALGGFIVVLATATVVLSFDAVDVSGFYPRATRADDYRFDGRGFVNARRGFRVDADGDVTRFATADVGVSTAPSSAPSLSAVPPRGRGAAALALAFAGAALSLLAALVRRDHRGRSVVLHGVVDGVVVVASIGLSIIVFHAAAVGRVASAFATMPAALLLAWALFRYRAPRWTPLPNPTPAPPPRT